MEVPIACTLSPAVLSDRVERAAALARRALLAREPLPGGARLRFAPGAQTERELRALVAAEAACCPFLRLSLYREPGALRLDVTGPPEARPVVDALFAPPPVAAPTPLPEPASS